MYLGARKKLKMHLVVSGTVTDTTFSLAAEYPIPNPQKPLPGYRRGRGSVVFNTSTLMAYAWTSVLLGSSVVASL